MDSDAPDPPLVLCDEALEVRRHRYQEARAAGLSIAEAELFADGDGDVGVLRKLVAGACDPAMIAAILI